MEKNASIIVPVGAGEHLIEESEREIRTESKLVDFKDTRNPHFRYDFTRNAIKVIGAAGETENSEINNLKLMTDPYTPQARKDMIDCAYKDPILSASFERRKDAQFENGFDLDLELGMTRDPTTKEILTPEQVNQLLRQHKPQYLAILERLEQWTKDMSLESIMDEFTVHQLDQGRCCAFFFPGIMELQEISSEFSKPLPNTLEIVPVDDLREPIVDTSSGNKIVGVNTEWKLSNDSDRKRVIRKDEMVYGVVRNYMLRKDSRFYGSAVIEPILIMSKTLKRLYDFDIPDAVVASYITKIIFQFNNPQVTESKIRTFINSFIQSGKKAFGISQDITPHHLQHKVDVTVIQSLEKILVDSISAVLGVPKSQLNREHNLNRDIATVEAIQFEKNIVKADERRLSELFESQLLNPLFAYLCGKKLSEIPVRVKIKARPKPEEKSEKLQNNLEEQKESEINSQSVIQDDAITPLIGASGDIKKKLNQYLQDRSDLRLIELNQNVSKN